MVTRTGLNPLQRTKSFAIVGTRSGFVASQVTSVSLYSAEL